MHDFAWNIGGMKFSGNMRKTYCPNWFWILRPPTSPYLMQEMHLTKEGNASDKEPQAISIQRSQNIPCLSICFCHMETINSCSAWILKSVYNHSRNPEPLSFTYPACSGLVCYFLAYKAGMGWKPSKKPAANTCDGHDTGKSRLGLITVHSLNESNLDCKNWSVVAWHFFWPWIGSVEDSLFKQNRLIHRVVYYLCSLLLLLRLQQYSSRFLLFTPGGPSNCMWSCENT